MSDIETNAPAPDPGGLAGAYLKAMMVVAGSSMAAILAIMLVQIVARYVFNASLIWAEELCRYILIWQTFLLIGIAYHKGELVVLDMLGSKLGPRARLVIRFLVSLPVLFFLYLLIRAGWAHAVRFNAQTIPALDFIWTSLTGKPAQLPVFWVYVSVPVGCAILLGHLVVGLADEIRRAMARPSPTSTAS
jgi:TRAP-type C4-dicarboxylate transport system permease small subunit